MKLELIREKFIEMYGTEKYKEFVLTLYEAFPLRERLFFWQEEMLNNFCKHFNIGHIDYEKTYSVFNYCPVHNVKLEKDIIPIVDGNSLEVGKKREYLNPFANLVAPRNLEMFEYPKTVEVYFCQTCRKALKE